MFKVILLILAILLVYWFFWGQRKKNPADTSADKSAPASPEKMVICAHCQLHVPESECVMADGRHYCSDEHARLGQS
ncbi:MAG: PP0621 family protein [Rhodocyclaceae bacterium]|nr:PP0621 family protein [Rhodocyclaceae bacterium]